MTKSIVGKNILIGITAGIAAYKIGDQHGGKDQKHQRQRDDHREQLLGPRLAFSPTVAGLFAALFGSFGGADGLLLHLGDLVFRTRLGVYFDPLVGGGGFFFVIHGFLP